MVLRNLLFFSLPKNSGCLCWKRVVSTQSTLLRSAVYGGHYSDKLSCWWTCTCCLLALLTSHAICKMYHVLPILPISPPISVHPAPPLCGFKDPANAIPGEYSSWGGFTKLHDDGLKTQIQMVKDLKNKADKNEEEAKISAIWEVRLVQYSTSTSPLHRWAVAPAILRTVLPLTHPPSFTPLHVSSSLPPSPFLII